MEVGNSVGLGLSDGTSVGSLLGESEGMSLGLSDGEEVPVTGEPVGVSVFGL